MRKFTEAGPSRPEVIDVVSELLAEIGIAWHPGDDLDAHLFDDLGFDSFDGYEMIVMIEEAFSLAVDETDFAKVFTVREIIEAVVGHYPAELAAD